MENQVRIVAFAGSTRMDSFNKCLAKLAASGAKQAGAEVTFVDLREYPMPLFDQDLEAESGLPEYAKQLKGLMRASDGFIISSPEYNSSISAVLKNAIDWVSRPAENEAPLAAYFGKIATLMSASPGGLGGLRGLVHLRAILGNIGVTVLPTQVAVPNAHEAFAADGSLKDARRNEAVLGLGRELVRVASKLKE